MHRRSFIKTVGAVASTLFAPTIILRDSIDRESILNMVCDWKIKGGYDVSDPFSIGSLTYSTNGLDAIRTELVSTIDDGVIKKRPPMDALFAECQVFNSRLVQWRPLELPPMEELLLADYDCPVCRNAWVKCNPDYSQTGDPTYDIDDDSVRVPCDWCNRKDESKSAFELAGFNVAYYRFKRLHDRIPGMEFCILKGVRFSHLLDSPFESLDIAAIRGEGFEGIMSISNRHGS